MLEPLGARILVRRMKPPEQTRGGIYLLGREYPTLGRVIAIGHGRKINFSISRSPDLPPYRTLRIHLPEATWGRISVGDFIMFHRDAVRQELVLHDDHIMLSREHCLAYYGADMQNFRPLGDRVLIKPIEETKQIGSIYLPDQSVERPVYGHVVAVGEGRFLGNGQYVPCDVRVGDKVLYGKYMGSDVKLDDKPYVLVREDDILGIEHE